MDWKSEYSLGIQKVDDEHAKFIRLISNIEAAIELNVGPQTVLIAITQLKRFAKEHFESEEVIMRIHGYKQAAQHADAHRDFIQQLEEIGQRTLSNLEGRIPMLQYLRDWFTEHLSGADREFAEYFLQARQA